MFLTPSKLHTITTLEQQANTIVSNELERMGWVGEGGGWKIQIVKNDIQGFLKNEMFSFFMKSLCEKWAIVSKETRYLCVIVFDG